MPPFPSTRSYILNAARRGRLAWRVAVAGALVLTVALCSVLGLHLGYSASFATLFVGVTIAAWTVGSRVAVAFALFGYLACHYLLSDSRYELSFTDARTLAVMVAYALSCGLIIAIGETMRSAQDRAHARGELLRVALAGIDDAIIATDIESRITYLNESAEVLTGWSCREAIGHPLNTVFRLINTADDDGDVSEPMQSVLARGGAAPAPHATLLGRDAVARCIEQSTAPIEDANGQITGCVVTFRDITEKKRRQREAAERAHVEGLLAAIVASSDDAIISTSRDGIVRTWNTGAERLLGHAPADMIGSPIDTIIPSHRREKEQALISETLEAGHRVEHLETERVHSSGRHVLVSLTISPVLGRAGDVVGAVNILRDMTRQSAVAQRERLLLREVAATNERSRVLEEEVRTLAADLAEADRRRGVFLATLARALQDLLTPLGNALRIIRQADRDRWVTAAAAEMIDGQTTQIGRLVDDLLDLSRIAHDEPQMRKDVMELGAVIRDAVEACRAIAAAAGHEVRIALPSEPVYMHADGTRLVHLFSILVRKACKDSRCGGTISVTAKLEADRAFVTVKNNGIPLPLDKIENLRAVCAHSDASTAHARGVSDISLMLAAKLAAAHGGTMTDESADEGRASEFVVRLPVAAVSPRGERAITAPSAAPKLSRRVLVVDDDHGCARSLVRLLQLDGHVTFVAHDGAEALEAAERHRPDLVFLDINMPVMDGYETCRQLRQRSYGKNMIILALTAWGRDSDRRRTREAGFDGHFVKPASYGAIAAVLDCAEARDSRQ